MISRREERVYQFLILICILVYLTGWQVPLMEIDAAQYASISREMLLHHHFLELYDHGKDYLDKPPMLFWLSSASMYLFGINDKAYRLPSFLFAILSIYSVFRFTLIFYQKRVALLSALILASCQAMFLINHDVRTDTMLMGWVTWGIWQLSAWYVSRKWKHLILASVAIGGGMLTKGPIALIVPILAFSSHFILRREFRLFFRWEYLIMLGLIAALLFPMSWGLYMQFDLHPEKSMYGHPGISGLRFFYWTQSFGRITGESTWHENDHFSFLFENMLWGFLPWILFFMVGMFRDLLELLKKKFKLGMREEWISTGGFLLTYCALGISRAQLPHYIYVVFPLAAVITGKWAHDLLYTQAWKPWAKPFFILHVIILTLLVSALFFLLYLPFPPVNWFLIIFLLTSILLLVIGISRNWFALPSLLIMACFSILIINTGINTGFYPKLLNYQMSVAVNNFVKAKKLNINHLYIYKMGEEWSLSFYTNHDFVHISQPDSLSLNDLLLTGKEGKDSLKLSSYKLLYEGQAFHVSMLTLEFLNPSTRPQSTKPFYILQKTK